MYLSGVEYHTIKVTKQNENEIWEGELNFPFKLVLFHIIAHHYLRCVKESGGDQNKRIGSLINRPLPPSIISPVFREFVKLAYSYCILVTYMNCRMFVSAK